MIATIARTESTLSLLPVWNTAPITRTERQQAMIVPRSRNQVLIVKGFSRFR